MKKVALIFILVAACGAAYGQKKFELADLAKLTNLSDPQISPDGKSVVLVVSRPDYKLNRYNAELVAVDIATGKQRVLTYERPSVSQPRWSPGGQQFSFWILRLLKDEERGEAAGMEELACRLGSVRGSLPEVTAGWV